MGPRLHPHPNTSTSCPILGRHAADATVATRYRAETVERVRPIEIMMQSIATPMHGDCPGADMTLPSVANARIM